MFSFKRFFLGAAVILTSVSADLEAYQNVEIFGKFCFAHTDDGIDIVMCTYEKDVVDKASASPDATIFSKITEGSCADNQAFATSSSIGSNPKSFAVFYLFDTVPLEITVTDAEKNCEAGGISEFDEALGQTLCVVTKYACTRADLVDDEESVSVKAAMMDATITYKYAQDGSFDVSVDTDAFDPSNVSSVASRTVDLLVFKGECGATTCELTGADSSACYSGTMGGPLEVGSTMDLCIVPADDDVKVIGLQGVTIVAAGESGSATTIVDADGNPNFVTYISPYSTDATTTTTTTATTATTTTATTTTTEGATTSKATTPAKGTTTNFLITTRATSTPEVPTTPGVPTTPETTTIVTSTTVNDSPATSPAGPPGESSSAGPDLPSVRRVQYSDRGITLSSLMIPKYFDEQLGDAGSISISGTALLEYIDVISTRARRDSINFDDRRLQSSTEESRFAISVPVQSKEMPDVIWEGVGDDSSAKTLARGGLITSFVVVGAYFLL